MSPLTKRASRRRQYRRKVPLRSYIARVSRQVNVKSAELKCFTLDFNNSAAWAPNLAAGVELNATWSFASVMAGLVQGTGVSQRIGNQIFIINIELWVELYPNQTGSSFADGAACRVVCFKFKDPRGSLPNMTGTGPQIFDANRYLVGRAVENVHSFAMLEDFTHQMVAFASAPATPSAGPRFSKCIKIPVNSKFDYGGNAGTISDCVANDINLGVCADNSGCCRIGTFYTKVWFKDL